MDKLALMSGALFLAADIFAVTSLAMPDWITTEVGEYNTLYSMKQGRIQEFVRGGGALHPLGPENPLISIDFPTEKNACLKEF